jgi:small subunit ribosomal protein S1
MSNKPPINKDDEPSNDFSSLLDTSMEYSPPARGDIRHAEILEIRDNEIVVGLGAKRDGIVPAQDVERLEPSVLKSLHVGDVVPVYILNPNDRDGNLLVSLNLGLQGRDWEDATRLMSTGEIIEAEVTGFNRGGLLVRVGRLEGFVPASHLVDIPIGVTDQERKAAVSKLIGSMVGLKVIEVNQARRRLILSQREAQRGYRARQKERLLGDLEVGSVVKGKVTGIRDFGVFVDVGGADGLIHVSELDWHRVPHPADVVKVGQEIDVYVLELDRDHQRIALSLRRTRPDPWAVVEQTYQIGQVVEGTVSNVVDFGAFVVLEDGIEGLLHLTEMGDGTYTEPYSYVRTGDKVTVRIVRIEPDRKRIGFTQRDLDGTADSATKSAEAEPVGEEPPKATDAMENAAEAEARPSEETPSAEETPPTTEESSGEEAQKEE